MRLRRLARAAVVIGVMAAAAAPAQEPAGEAPLLVFAAASLSDAFKAVGAAWAADGHPPPVFSFAASSLLARQIAAGAPAALFASADEAWMDALAAEDLIVPQTRTDLLGNALVLVAPADAATEPVTIGPGLDLAALLGADGRLAIGDPAHVPAGRYAREALAHLDLWGAVENRLAPADNVRAALALVAQGEAPLGIVYATDAAIDPAVIVLGIFPAESHRPITYPVALLREAEGDAAAGAFLDFLTGDEAAAIFARYGFVTD